MVSFITIVTNVEDVVNRQCDFLKVFVLKALVVSNNSYTDFLLHFILM